MKRVDIVYGGGQYSLGGRTLESIQNEVETALASGKPYWLRVNSGGGVFEDAYLLIVPGIPFAILNVKSDNGTGIDLDVDGAFNPDVL
ncbi:MULTISPECIES: hypothetical protein [Cryobacterium]|uniref:Uncharacterized protein n=1 Tax=Cryobacterium breve TaxID=1259258 RepID=A0ABY2IZJ4_9MICO|nr:MULTISPECIES: hypothetical protein [Cryobacterium]TFC96196.1 hypothetical protein E3O65_14315 [Cryobacterium breve]TFC98034.1 hypothetical protein E3T20_00015 [Cryobacterium sp. TmT3-12]